MALAAFAAVQPIDGVMCIRRGHGDHGRAGAYFLVALVMHIRARDLRRYLYVNCLGMLAASVGAFAWVIAT